MSDLSTGLMTLGAAIGSKDLIIKVLGPTADYLGDGLRGWTKRRLENLGRAFAAAERKLPNLPAADHAVPPRVFAAVLNEASFVEDAVTTEYFGGVLASSRSGVSRDDRGASLAALISRLSAYQLRTHFAFYAIIRRVFLGSEHSVLMQDDRDQLQVYIPEKVFAKAMAFSAEEDPGTIISHALFGLAKEDLIAPPALALETQTSSPGSH